MPVLKVCKYGRAGNGKIDDSYKDLYEAEKIGKMIYENWGGK